MGLKEIEMNLEQEKLKLSLSWSELRLRKWGEKTWSCVKLKIIWGNRWIFEARYA